MDTITLKFVFKVATFGFDTCFSSGDHVINNNPTLM